MKALRSFTVRPSLPPSMQPLESLAMNLRWSWDERTRDLFRWVDPDAWEGGRHDPVALLGAVGSLMNVVKIGQVFAGTAERPSAVVVSTIMFVVLVAYIVLGVRSFIAARRGAVPS